MVGCKIIAQLLTNHLDLYQPETQEVLGGPNCTIKPVKPQAEEHISYRMLTFKFAASRLSILLPLNQIGFYGASVTHATLADELSKSTKDRGSISHNYLRLSISILFPKVSIFISSSIILKSSLLVLRSTAPSFKR